MWLVFSSVEKETFINPCPGVAIKCENPIMGESRCFTKQVGEELKTLFEGFE